VESAQAERRNLEYQLETCLKEVDSLHQQIEKEMLDHQEEQAYLCWQGGGGIGREE
jgi:hypothetical protein